MNIAAILKYYPKGTELYSLVDGEVTFVKVLNIGPYSIEVVLNDGTIKFYTEDGLYFANRPNGECVLFPSKDQRDWNKFRTPKIKVMNRQQAKELLPIIRTYLFEKYHSKCQICGWDEINPFTGRVPLQIHHIDGDSCNNREENLQLLCPNCHSLTENFGSRNDNANSGRSIYYGKAMAD